MFVFNEVQSTQQEEIKTRKCEGDKAFSEKKYNQANQCYTDVLSMLCSEPQSDASYYFQLIETLTGCANTFLAFSTRDEAKTYWNINPNSQNSNSDEIISLFLKKRKYEEAAKCYNAALAFLDKHKKLLSSLNLRQYHPGLFPTINSQNIDQKKYLNYLAQVEIEFLNQQCDIELAEQAKATIATKMNAFREYLTATRCTS